MAVMLLSFLMTRRLMFSFCDKDARHKVDVDAIAAVVIEEMIEFLSIKDAEFELEANFSVEFSTQIVYADVAEVPDYLYDNLHYNFKVVFGSTSKLLLLLVY